MSCEPIIEENIWKLFGWRNPNNVLLCRYLERFVIRDDIDNASRAHEIGMLSRQHDKTEAVVMMLKLSWFE